MRSYFECTQRTIPFLLAFLIFNNPGCNTELPSEDAHAENEIVLKAIDKSNGFQGIHLGDHISEHNSRASVDHQLTEEEILYHIVGGKKIVENCREDVQIKVITFRDIITRINIDVYCPAYNELIEIFTRQYGKPDQHDSVPIQKAEWRGERTFLSVSNPTDSSCSVFYADLDSTQYKVPQR